MRALAHRCADRRSGLLARALFAQPQSCKIELRQLRTLRTGHSSRMPQKRGTEWFGQVSGVRPSRSTSARRCSATQTWLPTPVCGCTSATLTALGSAAPVKTQTGCCASSCPSTPACRSTPMTTSTPSPTASTRGRAARATGRRLCTCSHRARQAHIDLELMRNQATSGSSAKPPSLRAGGRHCTKGLAWRLTPRPVPARHVATRIPSKLRNRSGLSRTRSTLATLATLKGLITHA